MDAHTLTMLTIIGTAGYLIFRFWKVILKLIIGLLCFCVVYTYISLKKYFTDSKDNKDKIEQVAQETVKESIPTYINE
jgi:hypothetical protein